ncbi:hypothetical protein BCV69DRAFT_64002 [Microstroma glucosiphilum]|uniref:Wax synthase domain-containing protein n=1 Tax=Pseudomicrostroma glucosiphilum TaxID=1684307 RepID=A0A316U086_9BASI|nr:hypothetical protein BCV69DRAFT_64002 [Pseudomicrostroma glucosiphilum]PWN18826.1 hypothetical protein BCV69DRAFT_64002 [Pseudomicrostroma glucosiphilum]
MSIPSVRMTTMIDWNWIKMVLIGPAPPPPLDAVPPPHGALRGFGLASFILLLLVICSMTLPSQGKAWIRLTLLPGILYLSLALSCKPELGSFGSLLLDCFWPLLGWNLIAKAVDVCICGTFVDREGAEKSPRWIVPKSQAGTWEGAVKLDLKGQSAETRDGEKREAKMNGHASDEPKATTSPVYGDIEAEWYAVPHSQHFFSLRRLLWACDHLFLLRPHTSWILPTEQRALEWAHKDLVRAALDPSSSRYGKPEDQSIFSVIGKVSLMTACLLNERLLLVPPGPAFYSMPVLVQAFNVLFYGALICLSNGPIEYFAFPLLRRVLPVSALLPMMNQPLLAKGPAEFWGKRWHAMVRRSSWRLSRLFPGGRHPVGNKLWAFVITGSMHSIILARWLPPPPTVWYVLVLLLVPGPMAFFVGQGVLVALELALLGPLPSGAKGQQGERWTKTLARRALTWGGILVTCRYFVGAIAATGMHTAAQRSHGFGKD